MNRSLRRTLAVRFAATMSVGLLAAAVAAYCATSVVLRRQLDNGLASAAFLAHEHFEQDGGRPGLEPLIMADPGRYARDVNRYMVLRDPTGTVTGSLPTFAADLPLDTAAFRVARKGAPAWVDEVWRGRPIRSLYTPLGRRGVTDDRVLQVSASLDPVAAVQGDMLLALALVVLLGTAATLFGAWWLAGSAVRPVHEITEQATRVEAGTLDQRIAAHADTAEYRGLVGVLNRMLERLDAAFKNQRRLTADVSHELRSPLTALRGEMEVALRAERSARDYQRVLHSALEEIDRLTEMSEDLLLITRAEARLLHVRRVATDVTAIVEGALAALRPRIEEREIAVEPSLAPAAGQALADPVLITRLVRQLLDNAVKFTPVGGRIRVTTAPLGDGGGVRLRIENSGPPIAPEDLPHIFEPFYRADEARSRGTGTGLGLAVAGAIARLHGGGIRVGNQNGTGVWFEVDLPTAAVGA